MCCHFGQVLRQQNGLHFVVSILEKPRFGRFAIAFVQRSVADFSSVGRRDLGLSFYRLNERFAVLRRAEHDAS